MILPFKMASKCIAEVMSRVPKCKKSVLSPVEKMCVLDKLCSAVRCSVVGMSSVLRNQ